MSHRDVDGEFDYQVTFDCGCIVTIFYLTHYRQWRHAACPEHVSDEWTTSLTNRAREEMARDITMRVACN